MKKRRLIALMCAMVIGATTLVGCDTQQVADEAKYQKEYNTECIDIKRIGKDKHVIINDGTKTLHKGNIYAAIATGNVSSGSLFTIHEFECGKELHSTYDYSFSNEMPSEDEYDEICEDCFNLNN